MFRYTNNIIPQRILVFIFTVIFSISGARASNICSTQNYNELIKSVKRFHQATQYHDASNCINKYLEENKISFNEELYSFLVLGSLWSQNYLEADKYLNSFPKKNKQYHKLLAKKYWYQGDCQKYIETVNNFPQNSEERENLGKCQNQYSKKKKKAINLTYAHYSESQNVKLREKNINSRYSPGKANYQFGVNFLEREFDEIEFNDVEFMVGYQKILNEYSLGGAIFHTPNNSFVTKNKFIIHFSTNRFENWVLSTSVKRYIYTDVKLTLLRFSSEYYAKHGVFIGTAETEINALSKYFINLKYINPEKKLSPIFSFSIGKSDSSRPYLTSNKEETFVGYGLGGKYNFSDYSVNVYYEHRDENSFYYDLIQLDAGVRF